jgi:CRISPR-associated protein Cmr4
MFKIARPMFLFCRTPLHCGSGNDLGIVDLPIQRERHTNFPKIEASSLKGGIREAFEKNDNDITVGSANIRISDEEIISQTFGPEDGAAHAGSISLSDGGILLFPVKSMKGIFSWITCPQVLERFKNFMLISGIQFDFELPKEKTAPSGCGLFVKDNKIVLEEYTFEIQKDIDSDGNCTKLANWLSTKIFGDDPIYKFWAEKIKTDIVVLPDDAFRDFVNLSTEVITRTKIDNETGTVQPGALFTEEYLPSETILYSIVFASPIFKEDNKGIFEQSDKSEEELVMEYFVKGIPQIIQLGGNATLGKGIVRTKVMGV